MNHIKFSSKHKINRLIEYVNRFVRNNVVFIIATILAVATSFIIKPDAEYIKYFDFKTLTCLFCTLAIVCALKNIKFFTIIAQKIVKLAGNTRTASILLVYITFIGSMLIANDMALVTFLPLGYYVFSSTKFDKYIPFVFIMQNISANLGGMLTPFGNPQNLFIYEKFSIANSEFMSIMLLPFLVSISLITICCFIFVKKESMEFSERRFDSLPIAKTVFYIILFLFSILLVFRVVPYLIGLILIPVALIFTDRDALKRVDYPLLLTFVAFFIFAGNMGRIELIRSFFSSILESNTLLVSIVSCQIISNVPSAILLSQFTDNYRELLLGVNIGGTGTLISSLASLITFREYTSRYPGQAIKYILLFSAFNFGLLISLTFFCFMII